MNWLLSKLRVNGQIRVLAPLALTPDNWLNVNADTAAADVARVLKASQLYLLTVPRSKGWQSDLCDDPQDLPHLIEEKVITDGMQKLSAG